MAKNEIVLLELVRHYAKLRTAHSLLTKDKDEVSVQIKAMIGDRTEVPVEGFRVSYRYDNDKEITKFDVEKMAKKDPKAYKQLLAYKEKIEELTVKFTKTETVSGSRRLLIEDIGELE